MESVHAFSFRVIFTNHLTLCKVSTKCLQEPSPETVPVYYRRAPYRQCLTTANAWVAEHSSSRNSTATLMPIHFCFDEKKWLSETHIFCLRRSVSTYKLKNKQGDKFMTQTTNSPTDDNAPVSMKNSLLSNLTTRETTPTTKLICHKFCCRLLSFDPWHVVLLG